MGSRGVLSSLSSQYSAFNPYRLWRQESGFGSPVGAGDAMAKSLYCGMKPVASWECSQENALPTGGIFNLEFSPEGTLLVAACEKKSVQIFDPLTHHRIYTVNGAHSDCVNCVKFLDARMFATCSDDTTIALWDVRNLKKKIRTLLGHSNWVKNIEFSVKDKLLVTSGLDGSIYTWDINSYTECNLVHQRVFNASGLMRCRLSPDARQMVMCTTGGLLVIIHDLNLSTLAQDLHGFKPTLFRLMQMSQQLIPIAVMYDYLFDHKRKQNRVEFVSDFPDGNDAEVVSALQIHPQGWTALSRNISHDDKSEWSCIHDIQPVDETSDKGVRDSAPAPSPSRRSRRPARRPLCVRPYLLQANSVATASGISVASVVPSSPAVAASSADSSDDSSSTDGGGDAPDAGAARTDPPAPVPPRSRFAGFAAGSHPASMQNDVWEASITVRQHRMLQEMASRGQVGRNFNMQRIMGINTGITPPPAATRARVPRLAPPYQRTPHTPSGDMFTLGLQAIEDTLGLVSHMHPILEISPPPAAMRNHFPRRAPASPRTPSVTPSTSGQTPASPLTCEDVDTEVSPLIRQNRERLLFYTEETNEGKGFIKELCYSADGRLVCSPFGCGMRLLALNEDCSELSHCLSDTKIPAQMADLGQVLGIHQDLVVSSKFSPRHCQLVTGCLDGKIVWYMPYSGEA